VGSDLLIAEPQAFRHPQPEVLQKRIGVFDQSPQNLHPFGALQVDENAALAAIDVGMIPVHLPAVSGPFFPGVVDLDDLRTEFGERPRRGWPRQHLRRVHDSKTFQCR